MLVKIINLKLIITCRGEYMLTVKYKNKILEINCNGDYNIYPNVSCFYMPEVVDIELEEMDNFEFTIKENDYDFTKIEIVGNWIKFLNNDGDIIIELF